MIFEMYTHADRLVYLQNALEDKVVVLSEPSESGQLKISIDVRSSIDVMEIFHAGVKFGLDEMQKVFVKQ
jgi:hypothetical protein